MKQKPTLEPGFLRTFRTLSWVLMGISVFQAASIFVRVGSENLAIHPVWIIPFGNFLLLGLLYWPNAIRKTGRFFVPLLIIIATVDGILRTYLTTFLRFNPDINISILVEGNATLTIPFEFTEFSLILASWQLIPLLFVPLIMVAWQYHFKAVVIYVVSATLLDIAVFLSILDEQVFLSIISVTGILIVRTFTFLVVGFLVTQMMTAQRKQRQTLRDANRKLLGFSTTLERLTTSRERNRLARELHDTLAHTLSGLAVQLEAIKALWQKDNPQAKKGLDEAIDTNRLGLNETRRALKALRAEPLEDLGLVLALSEMAHAAASRCGAQLEMRLPKVPLELNPNISQAFYRAAQEILENIVRHAEAKHILLQLENTHQEVKLTIRDDGSGFDPGTIKEDAYGLQGLEERAALINGFCHIESQKGQGTIIQFGAGGQMND
jgi:signal transduction histidine kinase